MDVSEPLPSKERPFIPFFVNHRPASLGFLSCDGGRQLGRPNGAGNSQPRVLEEGILIIPRAWKGFAVLCYGVLFLLRVGRTVGLLSLLIEFS